MATRILVGVALGPAFLAALYLLPPLALAVLVTVSFIMLIYISGLYTVSSDGIRRMCSSLMDFLTGTYIPLPFFPASFPFPKLFHRLFRLKQLLFSQPKLPV